MLILNSARLCTKTVRKIKKLPLVVSLQQKYACGTPGFYESLIGGSIVVYIRLLLTNPTQYSVDNIGSYHVDIWRELGRHTEFCWGIST
jgi:hypothetical protein